MLGSTLPSSGLASARLCELGGDGGFKIHRSLFCPCLWTRLCHSDTVCRSGMMHLALGDAGLEATKTSFLGCLGWLPHAHQALLTPPSQWDEGRGPKMR